MVKKVISGLAILFVLVYVFEAPDDAGRALRGGFESVVEFLGAHSSAESRDSVDR